MELNWLRYFYFVVQEGGFTRAADRLSISQPGISKAVKQLEDYVGTQLIDRNSRSLKLTAEGNEIFRYCKVIMEQSTRIESLRKEQLPKMQGTLKLVAAEGIGSKILPEVIAAFRQLYSDVRISFVTGVASDLIERIERGEAEAGYFFHIPELPKTLLIEQAFPVVHKIVCSPAHLNDDSVRRSFIGSKEIDNVSNTSFPTLSRIQADYPEATITISSNSMEAHKNLALLGLGVAILPKFMVQNELSAGTLTSVYDDEDFIWQLKFVLKKDAQPSPLLRAFAAVFESFRI